MKAALDLVNEYIPAPAVLQRGPHVPFAMPAIFHEVEYAKVMAPRNLSNKLLDNCFLGPSLSEGPHVKQVGPGEALHVRELAVQVRSQTLDRPCAPAGAVLAYSDFAADARRESAASGPAESLRSRRGTDWASVFA
jgi:hypothetical protein